VAVLTAAGSRSLASFAAGLSTKFGEDRIANGPPPVIVPTGSHYLDWALRVGGWQLGRVYEVYGPKDAGKTTLTIASMIQHSLMFPDRGVAYINMEQTFETRRARAMGLDCSKEAQAAGRWIPMLPEHSEHVSDMAREVVGSGYVSIVVIDSIGAMESDKTLNKTAEKAADAVGRNAKIITQMGKALATLARINQCTVLLVNQPRAAVGSPMGGDVSAGPKHMQHATTSKIEMRGLGGEDDLRKLTLPGDYEPQVVSSKTRIRVPRLKNALPGRIAECYVNRIGTDQYGPAGIDCADELITLALREKIVTVGGSYYTLPDGHKIQGRIAFAQHLRAHPEACELIRKAIPFESPIDPLED
jgi:recombination protein RecA